MQYIHYMFWKWMVLENLSCEYASALGSSLSLITDIRQWRAAEVKKQTSCTCNSCFEFLYHIPVGGIWDSLRAVLLA